jgi:hypothetical protein
MQEPTSELSSGEEIETSPGSEAGPDTGFGIPDTFEQFPPGQACDSALPLNPIKDEFILSRLVPLVAAAGLNSTTATVASAGPAAAPAPAGTEPLAPVVLPNDLVDPDLAAALLDAAPEATVPAIKGGVPLVDEWAGLTLPQPTSDGVDTQIEIENLEAFLADPQIALDGTTQELQLTPAAVRGLVNEGSATVLVTVDGQPELVGLRSQPIREPAGIGNTVEVDDLFAFLSNPEVELSANGAVPVTLNAENVGELTQTGTTEVTVQVGGQQQSLVLQGKLRGGITYPDPQGDADQIFTRVDPLPPFELVLHLPYRQRWTLRGYSRGELLNSISLAPQEETTIEILSWDRFTRDREESFEAELGGEVEHTTSHTDALETVTESAKDNGWTSTLNGGILLNLFDTLQIGGGGSSATANSIRDLSGSTHNVISEKIDRAALIIKAKHQTRVIETQELGSETRVTRRLRNPNLCHALNLDCFEVLGTYAVQTQLMKDQVRLCALAPNPISGQFSRQFVITHEAALRAALLSPVYAKGFDAATLLAAAERFCEAKRRIACLDEQCARPGSGAPAGGSSPAVDRAREKVEKAMRQVKSATDLLFTTAATGVKSLLDRITIGPGFEIVFKGDVTEAERSAALEQYHRFLYIALFSRGPVDRGPRWLTSLGGFSGTTDFSPEGAERLLQVVAMEAEDVVNAPEHVSRYLLQLHSLVVDNFTDNVPSFVVRFLTARVGLNDAGVYEAIKQLDTAYGEYRAALSPQDGDAHRVQEAWETQLPPEYSPARLAEAQVSESALLAHMAVNESHYRHAVWESLNPNDRLPFLKSLGGFMRFVENEPLGFVGERAAFPLRADAPGVAQWYKDHVTDNPGLGDPASPRTVTLPGPGVALEPRLGTCDACEDFIRDHRALDLRHRAAEVAAARQRARQERIETRRYRLRLDQQPPLLDDPDPNQHENPIRLAIEQPQPPPPP